MITHSERRPLVIAGIVGCFAIILLVVIVAGGVYFFGVRGQSATTAQPAISGEIKDPIVTMLVASSIDEKGRPADPKFTFDASQPQMTVIVQVGKVTNAPLDLVWYQVTDEVDQKLFEHHVQVDAYERAYSIGKNPGLLASGTYKVVATLGSQTKTIEFDVGQKAAQPPTGGAPVSTRKGAPPVDGGSGKTASPATSTVPPGPPPQSRAPSGCQVTIGSGENSFGAFQDQDSHADVVEIISHADCYDPSALEGTLTEIRVSARVSGGFRPLGTYHVRNGEHNFGTFIAYPCSLDGERDLPGTKVEVIATIESDPSQTPVARGVITLGDDTFPPRALLDTIPPKGSKVKEGQKIDITVTAQEKHNESWQTGVKLIHVRETRVGGGQEFFKWSNPNKLPQPCGKKTWEHKEHTSYTVPKNPPPIIEICASAEDWNQSGPETCYQYRTGNKWNGKFHLVSSASYPNGFFCNNETWDGEFSVVAAANGIVQGKGSAHLVAPAEGNLTGGCKDQQATLAEFDVKGTWGGTSAFDRGLLFRLWFAETAIDGSTYGLSNYTFFLDPDFVNSHSDGRSPSDFPVPAIAPGDAEAQLNNSVTWPGQIAKGQVTIRMLCEDCK